MLSPLGATLIQSSILNAISNILAQLIDQYKHGVCIPGFPLYGLFYFPLPGFSRGNVFFGPCPFPALPIGGCHTHSAVYFDIHVQTIFQLSISFFSIKLCIVQNAIYKEYN